MGRRPALTQEEKEHIYRGKLSGQTLSHLAEEVGCSLECARKWWRVGRDKGLDGLRAKRCGRGPSGRLSQFAPVIAETALRLKKEYQGWGAKRVLVELELDAQTKGLAKPGPSSLAAFFKERCPECVATRKPRPTPSVRPSQVTGVHEMWQLDSQENMVLDSGEIATICNIRDPVGAAMIASRAFSVKTEKRWRKLAWTEVRTVLREAFTEWGTLPDGVSTDNELGLVGGPNDPFPGLLTLWLVGMGIKHRCIRPGQPTDQAQIERNHRTLNGLACNRLALTNIEHLQQSLDRERYVYNYLYPCRASNCDGHPPLEAYPELLSPRRPYHPKWELALFNIRLVYNYLADFTFQRKVNASAQVSLGGRMYSLGKKLVREQELQVVYVRFNPENANWVFYKDEQTEVEFVRRQLKGINVETLTDLTPQPIKLQHPIQLTLPCFVA